MMSLCACQFIVVGIVEYVFYFQDGCFNIVLLKLLMLIIVEGNFSFFVINEFFYV